jgi:hypothetical protein
LAARVICRTSQKKTRAAVFRTSVSGPFLFQ